MKEPKRIDERFSYQEFEDRGLDTEEASILADLLAQEIQQELHESIQVVFTNIVNKLNLMGHQLKLYDPPSIGHIAYRDDFLEKGQYHCGLRVAVDMTVSTGYSHLIMLENVYGNPKQ